jgi:hypothetical protein
VARPLVLASCLPGEDYVASERFAVVPIRCIDPLDYWRGVEVWWQSRRTIVNVEHDMECSDDLIQTLLDCPEPFCTWAYFLGKPSGGPHWAHRTGRQPPCGGVWIEEGDEWADFGGIGFCKIEPSVRVRELGEQTWQFVDIAVFASVQRQVHVHWPAIEHRHQ